MQKRQSLKDILKQHFKDTSPVVYQIMLTTVGAAVIHWGILPYLTSVNIILSDIAASHESYFQTLATLISLRLLKWLIVG